MYGYQLVRALAEATREALAYGEGSVYPVLHDLEARKLVKTRQEEVTGRIRTYYRISRVGRKRLEELTSRFRNDGRRSSARSGGRRTCLRLTQFIANLPNKGLPRSSGNVRKVCDFASDRRSLGLPKKELSGSFEEVAINHKRSFG